MNATVRHRRVRDADGGGAVPGMWRTGGRNESCACRWRDESHGDGEINIDGCFWLLRWAFWVVVVAIIK